MGSNPVTTGQFQQFNPLGIDSQSQIDQQAYVPVGGNVQTPETKDQIWQKLLNNVPDYKGFTDEQGNPLSKYLLNAGGNVNLDRTALNQFQNYATSQGTSPWAQLLLDKQGVEQNDAYDKAAKLSNAGVGTAYSELGAHGGLRSGAAERIATNASNDLNSTRQTVGRQGQIDRLGINANDQQNKLSALSQLPGMQYQASQVDLANRDYKTNVDKYNIDNTMKDLSNRNTYNWGVYDSKIKAAAADRTADAQEHSGKK